MLSFFIGFFIGSIVALFGYALILANKINEKEVNGNDEGN